MIMENRQPQPQKNCTLSTQAINNATAIQNEINIDECCLIKRLKAGDETAFNLLVEQYHPSLLRLARRYVRSYNSAEEVVQETWMGVFQGLPFFEGRSSLKTWIARILKNCAYTRALRDQRSIPFSVLIDNKEDPAVFPDELETFPGDWVSLREDTYEIPEACLLSVETHAYIAEMLQTLPASQRAVMVLCDIEGCKPEEICTLLGLSKANQRVLLHRARSKVRQALEKYFDEE